MLVRRVGGMCLGEVQARILDPKVIPVEQRVVFRALVVNHSST